ncbi:DNA polymerase [Priestia megaterium]|uniref:DNA polymerase n=1 Tax=Priestia megaterium TaxID=1404 RepID=UPI0028648760|nr:DNA polymerase [Priestia megaterium]MDR7207621.1 DNA polymerase-1 [Priestia megaterium]
MELNFNLEMFDEEKEKIARVKEAERKKALKEYQPTDDELWYTGYDTHTGRRKAGIFQTKISDADLRKLEAVKQAIDSGELGKGVDDMKKFTKSHALRLYQVLLKIRRESMIKHMIETKPDNYILVQTPGQLTKVCSQLDREARARGIISLDTETTGLNIHGIGGEEYSKIVGFVITIPSYDVNYYIPFGHITGEMMLPEHIVVPALKPFLEAEGLKKVLHNAKYDIHMMRNHGIEMGGFYFDTMVAMSLLNENEMSFALKNLANRYGRFFGYEDSSSTYEELFGKGGFEGTPLDIGTVYACKDGHLTWMFYQFIMEQFEKQPELKDYYFNIEQPITLVSCEMEKNGFLIDMDYAEKYADELQKDVDKLEEELKKYFGDINVNSPKQLSETLYDKLGLPDLSKKRSTDANTLKKLARENEGCKVLLEYRDLNKLLSTYVIPLPQKVDKNGRLHGQFKQSGTVTGRFSSSEPNLQNLPKKARKLIKAGDGKLIIGIDFSQIEPRVLASMSKDEVFKVPYATGQDLYSSIGSRVFNKPLEECGDGSPERKASKVILLGVMYGMSPKALADMLKIPQYEAESFITDFFNSYDGVSDFVALQSKLADRQGFVKTLFGRKRRFIGHQQVAEAYYRMCTKIEAKYGEVPTDIWGSDMDYKDKASFWKVAKPYGVVKRQSVNAVIQGTAAEIMKIAMIKLWRHCLKMGYKMLATVHDEILIEVPENITLEEVNALEEIMCNAVSLDGVPIKVDTAMMKVWGEETGKNEWFKEAV